MKILAILYDRFWGLFRLIIGPRNQLQMIGQTIQMAQNIDQKEHNIDHNNHKLHFNVDCEN